jgi:patatin-related protein
MGFKANPGIHRLPLRTIHHEEPLMREKELRVALVCFGGVSLAIYMHGITKEILKLVRASRALHAIADRTARAKASFFDSHDAANSEYDTEGVYFELLRDIGLAVELRVIVDIIAGASAGGINGAMLARALSHDLPMEKLRDLWLDNGDVSVLLAPEARATAWSKWFIKPVIWAAATTGRLKGAANREVRDKLSLFVRSRWFKPPLDGRRMAELMYDAVLAMGESSHPEASLLPASQRLDLFVTLTDYYGYDQQVPIHDPPMVREREHHHVLQFSYRRSPTGDVQSDFGLDNAPALAFAARATSSFPGAFPPASISEMDEVMARKGGAWPARAAFLASNFKPHVEAGIDPVSASFIDGSVLNNRPFHEAIAAITARPAYRQVDRRLVYIDPDPAPAPAVAARGGVPGFFSTIRGAMSDIPRNQPVTDELNRVNDVNEQMRRLKTIIEGARPAISRLVSEVIGGLPPGEAITPAQVSAWREQVNAQVARDAGFAYQGYVRLKLAAVRGYVSQLIGTLRVAPPRSPLAQFVAATIDAWAIKTGIDYSDGDSAVLHHESVEAQAVPRWASFFLRFDVEYRQRRLHFLIEGLNRLYQMLDRDPDQRLDPAAINRLKRDLYGRLGVLRLREDSEFFTVSGRALVTRVFSEAPVVDDPSELRARAEVFAADHAEAVTAVVDRLAREIDLKASTRDLDVLLAGLSPEQWPAEARRDVLVNYLGFPFWDVLTLSITAGRGAGELDEILIDRISPQDARTLAGFNGAQSLRGTGFGHFAAFLSRAYRENDYLLGRLHAIDRLIDLVCDSAGADATGKRLDVARLKKEAFLRVLDAEEKRLGESRDLIAALRQSIARIGNDPPARHSSVTP